MCLFTADIKLAETPDCIFIVESGTMMCRNTLCGNKTWLLKVYSPPAHLWMLRRQDPYSSILANILSSSFWLLGLKSPCAK